MLDYFETILIFKKHFYEKFKGTVQPNLRWFESGINEYLSLKVLKPWVENCSVKGLLKIYTKKLYNTLAFNGNKKQKIYLEEQLTTNLILIQ